jgi:hypothetical protein
MINAMINVVTVKQPWATAILELGKDVENRFWTTNYRGRLYIHSSLKTDELAHQFFEENEILEKLRKAQTFNDCGYILGFVDLVDIVTNSTSKWAIEGNYHWILANPVLLDNPIECKGKLKIWTYKPDDHNIYFYHDGQMKRIGDEWDDYGFDYRPC